jgi:hypothetical protein
MRLTTVGKLVSALGVDILDLLKPSGTNLTSSPKKDFKAAVEILKRIYSCL